MTYSHEVERMCPLTKGPNHGPAPIPEEGNWVKAYEIKDISGYTHGVGWCAPQQGTCKLSLNVKNGGRVDQFTFYRVFAKIDRRQPTRFRIRRTSALTDEGGNEYYYSEEMIIPVGDDKFALLVGLHEEDGAYVVDDEDEDVIIAKIVAAADGEDE